MKELEGKEVVLFCANYIYSGTLVSLGHDVVALRDAHIVYETGEFAAKKWKDAQRLPVDVHYIERSAVESFGAVARR